MLYLLIKRKRNSSILILEKKTDALLYDGITALHYLPRLTFLRLQKNMIFLLEMMALEYLEYKKLFAS